MSTVLITGASRGIGAATATEFAKHGYNLILSCSLREDKIKQLTTSLQETYHIKTAYFVCDISDFNAVEEGIKKCKADLNEDGNIDVLINNAGMSYVGLLQDMSINDWEHIIGVNLTGVFNTCKSIIPEMINRQRGRIINISSVWGNVGASTEVAYSASKGGVNAFTKALAKELAPSNIQVNAIACGFIDTQMNSHLTDEERNELFDSIPASRPGTPEEVASYIYSMSQSPAYLNGQIITFDGAWI